MRCGLVPAPPTPVSQSVPGRRAVCQVLNGAESEPFAPLAPGCQGVKTQVLLDFKSLQCVSCLTVFFQPHQSFTLSIQSLGAVTLIGRAVGVPEWRPQPARSGQEDPSTVKELHSDGNLTVLGHTLLSSHPIQLDFHFRLGNCRLVHWHGTLSNQKLFLDTPSWVLNQGTKESLTAVLEFVEQQTAVNYVFVNFEKTRSDRGQLLRAFAYMGFEVVQAGHPSVPPWADTIFMAYVLERDSAPSKAAENLSLAERGQQPLP
ncbi:ornithine decarboxylase antizyme 3 [Microcaecilia unicolor]|uniref:Ornithine decarboxylase antizyme 3 n=1 Tax=Microcaecilia unicolor TaxID=1415580 RepID=A0A6P7WQU1_9AMPH|nr:ornithine decarboxylase antizyme 3 [Microcaecilia unicolor]